MSRIDLISAVLGLEEYEEGFNQEDVLYDVDDSAVVKETKLAERLDIAAESFYALHRQLTTTDVKDVDPFAETMIKEALRATYASIDSGNAYKASLESIVDNDTKKLIVATEASQELIKRIGKAIIDTLIKLIESIRNYLKKAIHNLAGREDDLKDIIRQLSERRKEEGNGTLTASVSTFVANKLLIKGDVVFGKLKDEMKRLLGVVEYATRDQMRVCNIAAHDFNAELHTLTRNSSDKLSLAEKAAKDIMGSMIQSSTSQKASRYEGDYLGNLTIRADATGALVVENLYSKKVRDIRKVNASVKTEFEESIDSVIDLAKAIMRTSDSFSLVIKRDYDKLLNEMNRSLTAVEKQREHLFLDAGDDMRALLRNLRLRNESAFKTMNGLHMAIISSINLLHSFAGVQSPDGTVPQASVAA